MEAGSSRKPGPRLGVKSEISIDNIRALRRIRGCGDRVERGEVIGPPAKIWG